MQQLLKELPSNLRITFRYSSLPIASTATSFVPPLPTPSCVPSVTSLPSISKSITKLSHTMKFRPCIDLHDGVVKQIVGSSLRDLPSTTSSSTSADTHSSAPTAPITNFIATKSAAEFATMYKEDAMNGGHVIMLGKGNEEAAFSALRAYPQGLQVGGGITPKNAKQYIEAGASHIIVTSYVFNDGKIDWNRLQELLDTVGKEHLVLDLSCRKRKVNNNNNQYEYVVVTDRWQKWTDCVVNEQTLTTLAQYCNEFLIHGVDVEGMRAGIEDDLVSLLGQYSPIPVTYAGGVRNFDDIEKVQRLGLGKVDVSVGSALDIFGGNLKYSDLVLWSKGQQQNNSTNSSSSSSSGSSSSSSSSSSGTDISIRHDKTQQAFVASLQGSKEEAKLTYTILPKSTISTLPHNGILDITSTRVPSAFRGKQIAAKLADEAFNYANKEQYLVKPSCSYIADTYLEKNPEKKSIVILE